MLVMPSNNSGFHCGFIAGSYPGRLGWLLNTDSWRQGPNQLIPWALDNGAYAAWVQKRPWNEKAFYDRLDACHTADCPPPLWVVVPDVVTDREATLESWRIHAPRVQEYGHKLAMAVQDGMTPGDVPANASVVFVGGSVEWKWRHLKDWTGAFPRVHVGKVNSERLLWQAYESGAESCDGTGWFRGDQQQLAGLVRFLDQTSKGKTSRHPDLFQLSNS